MILIPLLDEAQMRRCRRLSAARGTCVDLLDRAASHDAAGGLALPLPDKMDGQAGREGQPVRLTVTTDPPPGCVGAALR